MERKSWLNGMNYSKTVSYERDVEGDTNEMKWKEGWWDGPGGEGVGEGKRQIWGKRGVRVKRLGWVILAGLKAKLLKFGLILLDLCFVLMFHVMCVLEALNLSIPSSSPFPLVSNWTSISHSSIAISCFGGKKLAYMFPLSLIGLRKPYTEAWSG